MNPKDRAGAKKPNLSVLPFAPLLDVIPALYEGRRKYGPWNWRAEEVSETIYADAAIRHLMQFISGEDIDPDSGVHHISKAIAGLLVVRDAQIHGCSVDDRYVNQKLQIDKAMQQLEGVNERYPEPVESALPPRVPDPIIMEVDGNLAILDPTSPVVVNDGETLNVTFEVRDEDHSPMFKEMMNKAANRVAAERLEPLPKLQLEFSPNKINLGDAVKFKDCEDEGFKIIAIDPMHPLPFSVGHTCAYSGREIRIWYDKDGNIEDAYKNFKQGRYDRITTIGEQTIVYELPPASAGMNVKTDGSIERWSAPAAGGGSYELTKDDVGKQVLLRNGDTATIKRKQEYSFWPYEYDVTAQDGLHTVTCTRHGQFSERADTSMKNFCEGIDSEWDIVKVFHK